MVNDGTLELTIIEEGSGEEIPARIRIRDEKGNDHIPTGAVAVPIAQDQWFVGYGTMQIPLPAGKADIRVERGPEYRPARWTTLVEGGKKRQEKIALARWIDMRGKGYVCGENHIHAAPEGLGALLAGEGLDFGTTLAWWNGPKYSPPGPAGEWWQVSFGGRTIAASLLDAEVEHEWGSVYLIGLKKPVDLAADPARSNLAFIQAARKQGALICYHAGWTREVLADALQGGVDVVNVCNNMFHRHKYLPRRHYGNLLEVEGMPEYANTPEDIFRMNCDSYYRLLNCGLLLAAGAGSACGAKTTPAGYNRAYVRAGKNPSYRDFLEAWRAGKNFVTNGPMLFLRTEKGNTPGDRIDLPAGGGTVKFSLTALAEQPLNTLELVANGKVVQRVAAKENEHELELLMALPIQEGMWVAGRCTGTDRFLGDEELERYFKVEGKPEKPCRFRCAHTSPIYITVDGRGAYVKKSVQEAEKMLEGFRRFVQKTAAEQYQSEILNSLPEHIPPSQ